MACGTAGGTAGQIAEIRVTLTSSDHREVDEYSLCHTSHSSSCESLSSLCKYSHNGYLQVKSIMQNRWNSRSSSFSKTIWNRYISHSVVTCIPFCHNRKRFVSSPFTLISVSVLVWITSQMAFVRDCGYNPVRWVSWLLRFCHVLFFDLLLHFIQALCIPFCRESVVHSLWHEAGVMNW